MSTMKKIGILFGQEGSFPPAFVERVNQKTGGKEIMAEFVKMDKVIQGEPCGYDVVIDRISQDVPFYRAWLKNAALTGTAVAALTLYDMLKAAETHMPNTSAAIKRGDAVTMSNGTTVLVLAFVECCCAGPWAFHCGRPSSTRILRCHRTRSRRSLRWRFDWCHVSQMRTRAEMRRSAEATPAILISDCAYQLDELRAA